MFLLMKPLISTGSATAFAVCSLACAIAPAQAAETVRKSYDIAGGDAVTTLKRFADESGRQVVFLVDAVRGVTTNPCGASIPRGRRLYASLPIPDWPLRKTPSRGL